MLVNIIKCAFVFAAAGQMLPLSAQNITASSSTGAVSPAAGGQNKPGKKARIPQGASIIMYTTQNEAAVASIKLALSYRELYCEEVFVSEIAEIEELGLMSSLKKAGMVKGSGGNISVSLPFFSVNGRLMTRQDFMARLPPLPRAKLRESRYPYISVYGTESCVPTKRKMEELDDAGLPYEFHDVGDPEINARASLLMDSAGITDGGWPMLDVSGHIMVAPSLKMIKKFYGRGG